MKRTVASLVCGLLFSSAPVMADINVGITLSTTGPAASLGIPERNTVQMLPQEIGGEKINYIVLDDATDTTAAARNSRKFVNENKVDVIIGSTTVPTSAAVAPVAVEAKTPQIALAPFAAKGDEFHWVFTVPQTNELMAGALIEHMKKKGVKKLGYIGYADVWGDDWKKALTDLGKDADITLTSDERFSRADASVGGQVLKVISSKPDAVLVGATGTPAALPHTELRRMGFKGLIYHTHGAANQAFLRIGDQALNGAILPIGPVVIWDKLPDSHPSKAIATQYAQDYEKEFGEGTISPFGAYLYDAGQILTAAIPVALEKAKPGTEEFRSALRDALENVKEVVGTHGVFNLSPTDHFGHDERARSLVEIQDKNWVLIED
ncbi:MAG TPA: ABC transporter substrate-binding protein [Alcaligenaceae bacterium]|nr:ABC transporter substrate-binding protein [Alcaligenaceae bacterium]